MMDEQSLGYGIIRIRVTTYQQRCDYSKDAEYGIVYQITKHFFFFKYHKALQGLLVAAYKEEVRICQINVGFTKE